MSVCIRSFSPFHRLNFFSKSLRGKSFFTMYAMKTAISKVLTMIEPVRPREELTKVISPKITNANSRYFAMSAKG